MKEREEEKKKIDRGFAALGGLMAVVGIIMIVHGISAYKTGAIIPATTKSGPMTGLQSIITGIIAGVAGLSFVATVVFRAMKRKGMESNNESD
jgi:membrane-bound ClpP family serine protease